MTAPKFISDSTPLIALSRIGRLDLARQVLAEVSIPDAVYEEIVEVLTRAPGAREVAEASWIRRASVDPLLVQPLRFMVDRGEAEAIALAQRTPGCVLLIDDRKARRLAKNLGIWVQGTLGVLARAKDRHLIPAIRPLVKELAADGWRISEQIVEEFLRRQGE